MQHFKSKFFITPIPQTSTSYWCSKPAARGFSSCNPGKVCSAFPHTALGAWCNPARRGGCKIQPLGQPSVPCAFLIDARWWFEVYMYYVFQIIFLPCHEGCFHLRHVLLCYCLTQSSVLLHFSMLNHLGQFLLKNRGNPVFLSGLLAIIIHTEEFLCKGSSDREKVCCGSLWGAFKEQGP